MDFYITALGIPPFTLNLDMDLGDGYEISLVHAKPPKYRINLKNNLKINYRLDNDDKTVVFPEGCYEDVRDILMFLNFLLDSKDDQNKISFLYDKFLNRVQVTCTDRASVLLPKQLCKWLGLPYITMRGKTIGQEPVAYNIGREYALLLCDKVVTTIYNQQRLPLLSVIHHDDSSQRSGGYRRLRRLAGDHSIVLYLQSSADLSSITFANGECLLVLHMRKAGA